MIGFNEDIFTNTEDITMPADAFGANRGYGAFDFFGVINKRPFYLERYIARFFNTLSILGLKIKYTPYQFEKIINDIVKQNSETDYFIKVLAYPIGSSISVDLKAEIFVVPLKMEPDSSFDYNKGVKIISKEYQRFLPEAKSTNYLPLVYWRKEIIAANAIDVLYYSSGLVRETSRGNVFIVKDQRVFTPHEKMLKGISRSVVIDILNHEQIPLSEQSISLDDLLSADEVFLSSTTKKILPVIRVGDKEIGDGKVGQYAKRIGIAFEDIQNKWC